MGLQEKWSVWRWEVDTGWPGTSIDVSPWNQPYIHIGFSTHWPVAQWHTIWRQTARDNRLQETMCNNSTHLYWINGLQWTDQFSMSCIVGVSPCVLLVCLTFQNRWEITCMEHWASVFSLYSIFFALFISTSNDLVLLFWKSHFFAPRKELHKWTYLRCVKGDFMKCNVHLLKHYCSKVQATCCAMSKMF